MEDKEEFYEYGPVMDEDKNEFTIFIPLSKLCSKEIERLEDGDDEFLLRGGQVQSFYVPVDKVHHIMFWDSKTRKEKQIQYEEYIARINNGSDYRYADYYLEKEFVNPALKYALNDAIGSEGWDGIVRRNSNTEYVAVIVNNRFFATYHIENKVEVKRV